MAHYYLLSDDRQFPNMKIACDELKLSSHAFRRLVKADVIKKINIDQDQAKEYGDELQTANSGRTSRARI